MGVAFSGIRRGVGYFPALSLSFGERCHFNFGRRPLEYPVEGFISLQAPPPLLFHLNSPPSPLPLGSLSYLLSCLQRLLLMEQKQLQNTAWPPEDVLITASIIFEYLAPILQLEYHVVNAWYPFLVQCTKEHGFGILENITDWMRLFMEDYEWESCMGSLFWYLGFKCRTTSLVQSMPNRNEITPAPTIHFTALSLALNLLRLPHILQFALSLDGFDCILEHCITFKQPNKADLSVLLPFVWWQGGKGEECSEPRFLQDMGMLNASIRVYEEIVYELILLMRNAGIFSSITSLVSLLVNTNRIDS